MPNLDDQLEKRLRGARPEAPPLPAEFAASVMGEIARRGLRPAMAPRRRWWHLPFAAVQLSAAALLLNWVVYEVRSNGSLELLYFGAEFLGAFFAALPLDLIALYTVTLGGGTWLLYRSGAFRVATALLVALSIGLGSGGGVALAYSGVNDGIKSWVSQGHEDAVLLGHYYMRRAHYRHHHPSFRMGRVERVAGDQAWLRSPDGAELVVRLPAGFVPTEGTHIRLKGGMEGALFVAGEGQRCGADVQRYFRHHNGGHMQKGGMMGPGHMRMGEQPQGRMMPPRTGQQ